MRLHGALVTPVVMSGSVVHIRIIRRSFRTDQDGVCPSEVELIAQCLNGGLDMGCGDRSPYPVQGSKICFQLHKNFQG